MMQNLKRNAPLVKNTNGKRMKKKLITYNPDVHVKKEPDNNESTMLNIEITDNDKSTRQRQHAAVNPASFASYTVENSNHDLKLCI